MSIGPVLIFDKSTLQSLSVDEAVWLDTFYCGNITPLFFVETLADLEADVARGRTPEQVVGNLAEKTPTGGRPNAHHVTLCLAELGGNQVEMRRVPVIEEGEPVLGDGETRALRFRESAAARAFQRWERGEFAEVERDFAREWRRALSNLDLADTYLEGQRAIKRHGRPRDMAQVKAMADELLRKPHSRYAHTGLESILPPEVRKEALYRWHARGGAPINTFAPYTAHVLTVNLFFCLALGADLIGRERPSNLIDLAYLYYLPFCMVFTSNDRLHERTVPVFLENDGQAFVWGPDLKAELARLDAHYSALPQNVKDRGVIAFAHHPPTEGDFLTSKLWDAMMSPQWRDDSRRSRPAMSPDMEKAFIEKMQAIAEAPRAAEDVSVERAGIVIMEHKTPVFRGKWRMVPPEAERG